MFSVRAAYRRLRREARDALELVLLPGLAAVLPWRCCFWIFKKLARQPWLYRESSEKALTEARQRGWVQDSQRWLTERRLTTLVDHADHYLARTRSNAWLRRHVDVVGDWGMARQAGVLMTFTGERACGRCDMRGLRGCVRTCWLRPWKVCHLPGVRCCTGIFGRGW